MAADNTAHHASHPVHTDPAITEPHARQISFIWQLGEITDDQCRTGTAIAELVVSHRPDTKDFRAFLRAGLHRPGRGTTFRYRLDQPTWSMRQQITRYSRPRLATFAARALAALRAAHPAEIAYAFDARRGDQA
jgi:hypothetical protein